MPTVKKSKRGKLGAKRFDPSDLRELVKDRRLWCAMGVVIEPEGGGSHFDLDGEDVLIEVETQPDLIDVTARLGFGFGGPNIGMYAIPPVGTEVVLLMPSGRLDFMPVVVGMLSTGDLPDGVAENVTVIANGEVLVHDGNGGTEPLVKKSEFDAHMHPTGTGPSGIPSNSPITGTTVLKAK